MPILIPKLAKKGSNWNLFSYHFAVDRRQLEGALRQLMIGARCQEHVCGAIGRDIAVAVSLPVPIVVFWILSRLSYNQEPTKLGQGESK